MSSLTFVTNNFCNGRLRSLLPEVHIGNGHCGGQPRGCPGALVGNRRQTTTVIDVSGCNRRKDPLQMLHDLFEVFT
jgi:hypothetical protein